MGGDLSQEIEVVVLVRDLRWSAEGHSGAAAFGVVARILKLQGSDAVREKPGRSAVVAGPYGEAVDLPVFHRLVDLAIEDGEIETGVSGSRRDLNVFPEKADEYAGEI